MQYWMGLKVELTLQLIMLSMLMYWIAIKFHMLWHWVYIEPRIQAWHMILAYRFFSSKFAGSYHIIPICFFKMYIEGVWNVVAPFRVLPHLVYDSALFFVWIELNWFYRISIVQKFNFLSLYTNNYIDYWWTAPVNITVCSFPQSR